MPPLTWHAPGTKQYETGLDKGVLFPISPTTGLYEAGIAWNGLISVSQKPSGAEQDKQYADNVVYATLRAEETFAGSIEAFMSPKEFDKCDGAADLATGVQVHQQNRQSFGLCYRTKIGDDLVGLESGYKIHIIYGASITPSERTYETMNEDPEAMTLSWDFDTVPVAVGGTHKPTASITINSKTCNAAKLAELEAILYGTEANPSRLPLPGEIKTLIETAG